MFQFLTHVEFSRSMVATLEMPKYVAYQKDVAYMLLLRDVGWVQCLFLFPLVLGQM